jgi:hypothetical protein
MAEVVVDSKAIRELAEDFVKAKRAFIGRLAERGYQLLRDEIKSSAYRTGNLLQGVAPPDVDYDKLQALLTVSARSAETGATDAKMIGADGKQKRSVTLKPQKPFNYAESVARGRRGFTAKGASLGPKGERPVGPGFARALLIPVPTAPSGESYLIANGQIFIFRRSVKATKPNPFDERAAKRLEGEAAKIGEAVLKQFV